MALSEIEKLERRYAENPQGLTFAPLAEVHRKTGDVARALDLLRPGLELHPDYIPASIVLGRCHLDLGDLPAAETAFTHVLGLDGENVIALKALADIGERQHHFDQAERWLRTLLSVDRSNDDARAQLERIEAARRDAGAAPAPPELSEEPATPPPEAADELEAPTLSPVTVADLETTQPVAAWVPPAADDAPPLTLEDLEPAAFAAEGLEPSRPDIEVEEPARLGEPVEPIAGLVGRNTDEQEPAGGDFRVELSEDIVLRSSGGHEFQVPDASAELSGRMPAPSTDPLGEERTPGFSGLEDAAAPVEPGPTQASVEPDLETPTRWPFMGQMPLEPEPVWTAPEPDSEPAAPAEPAVAAPSEAEAVSPAEPTLVEPEQPVAAQPDEPEPTSVEPRAAESETAPPVVVVSEPEPELVVTETMAEVLLDQGHSAEALRVYRELEMRNAGDPRLLRKIAELEDDSVTDAVPAPAEASPARRQYTAKETGGQSVREFFQAMLASRPPAAPSAPVVARPAATVPPENSGAPTRPAADALSLSSVFGEETTPLPPAVPAAGAAPGAGVSFDDFYSSAGAATTPKARAPDPKSDDLDQFHAWLQNLKR